MVVTAAADFQRFASALSTGLSVLGRTLCTSLIFFLSFFSCATDAFTAALERPIKDFHAFIVNISRGVSRSRMCECRYSFAIPPPCSYGANRKLFHQANIHLPGKLGQVAAFDEQARARG